MTLALLGANQALAGGLWLNEYGDFAGGRASAGAAAGKDEASTIIHNPATAGRIKGNQLFAAAGALIPKTKFDVQESDAFIGSDTGFDTKVGVANEFSDATRVGISCQSKFDLTFDGNLKLNGNIASGAPINTEWKDTYHYAAGFQYKLDNVILMRLQQAHPAKA
ncbi:Uncharacterised protein [Halioglobus japonicus]|nr:Uncharacterised protein [Halioglobus japonicus]